MDIRDGIQVLILTEPLSQLQIPFINKGTRMASFLHDVRLSGHTEDPMHPLKSMWATVRSENTTVGRVSASPGLPSSAHGPVSLSLQRVSSGPFPEKSRSQGFSPRGPTSQCPFHLSLPASTLSPPHPGSTFPHPLLSPLLSPLPTYTIEADGSLRQEQP